MEKHLLFLIVTIMCMTNVSPLEYTARYQPELDWVTIDPYTQNPRLLDLQIKCIIYDGPCDIVGRWVKPRVAAALLGTCIKCTKHQEGEVNRFLSWIQENRPEIFHMAVVKYVKSQGITLPSENVTLKPFSSTPATQNDGDQAFDDTEETSPTTTMGPVA